MAWPLNRQAIYSLDIDLEYQAAIDWNAGDSVTSLE